MNLEKGLPRDYTMFNPTNLAVSTCDTSMQQMVCSRSIRKMDVQGNVDASTWVVSYLSSTLLMHMVRNICWFSEASLSYIPMRRSLG